MNKFSATEIHAAVVNGGAVPYYQPIVGIDGSLAYEALGRLRVQGEILAPGQFLPALERTPYLAKFDRAILAGAIRQIALWAEEDTEVHVHVNASAPALVAVDYAETVRRLLRTHRVSPEALSVEVVETCTFWKSPATLRTLQALRQLGVKIAIDDFPCWSDPASLLRWLRANRTSVHTLKLDRSLVNAACGYGERGTKLEEAEATRRLDELSGYVGFAHELGLSVVAEGVENAEQAFTMQLCGVDSLQGFGIGKPLPAELAYHLKTPGHGWEPLPPFCPMPRPQVRLMT